MEKRLSKNTIALGILLFIIHAIILFGVDFLIIAISEGGNTGVYIQENINRIIFLGATVVILVLLTYTYLSFECRGVLAKLSRITECFLLLDLSLIISFAVSRYLDPVARPVAFFAIMAVTLIGRREAIFLNIIFSLMMFALDINLFSMDMWSSCTYLLLAFCGGTSVVFFAHKIKSRIQSILLVFILLIPTELIIGTMEILFAENSAEELILLAYGAFGSLITIVLYLLFLPLFEVMFSELTVFRLRELTADDAKLIKRLRKEAIGTYNHSVVVAQIVEACAAAIGEDAELARAAAYYHDVGKLKNPDMFTENQADYNLHNELSPELSADIIRAHARDGAALIRKYHLPEYFADIAVQHHGTLPIKYFYAKALRLSDGEINIANYSYEGPVPRNKIAAIIMIADAAEAASRSLSDRSIKMVTNLVTNIIEERIDLEQFKDCDITLRELSIITSTIASSLTGVYHSRISYPKIKISKK